MPRYYFDLIDQRGLTPDEEGTELPDLNAAEEEAARALADMTKDIVRGAPDNPRVSEFEVQLREGGCGPVLRVRFSFDKIGVLN